MEAAQPARRRQPCEQDGAVYTCADRTIIRYAQQVTKTAKEADANVAESVPRNGISAVPGILPVTVVAGTLANRDMTRVISGGPGRTYAFPRTATTACRHSFGSTEGERRPISVRLNEGLEELEFGCFGASTVKRIIFPSSVKFVDMAAFDISKNLEYVDLRTALGLKELGIAAFFACTRLKHVLLNDGLVTIPVGCFHACCVEEIDIPSSVKCVD